MRLWIDKYRPKRFDELRTNARLNASLSTIARNGSVPNLMFGGMAGSGKRTRVMAVLEAIFGPGVWKRKTVHRTFASGNSVMDINVVTSNWHLEITPSDAGAHDREVVQELIKEIAQNRPFSMESVQRFKVLVLNEVDTLTKEAQHALRRTMEKYTESCRLFLMCENPGNLIEPLRSRCLIVRVPLPSEAEVRGVLEHILEREDLRVPDDLDDVVAASKRNLRTAIMILQSRQYTDSGASLEDWETYIDTLARFVLERFDEEGTVLHARNKLNDMLINCIPISVVFKGLCAAILRHLDDETLATRICEACAVCEYHSHFGNKPIFHLECFVVHVIRELYNEKKMDV